MEEQVQLLIVLIVYMSFLVGLGIYMGRKVKSASDYSIAGRKLPGWVAALSERATGESSWALLGLPGAAYATGLMEIWTAIGCVAGIILAWIFLAWRIRREAEQYQADTFTQYISRRHGDAGKWIRIVSTSFIVFFFFFYIGAQFIGGGKTLHTMFGIDPMAGLLIAALIIIPYTMYGGFQSVVYTDCLQAILMIITLIIGPIAGFMYLSAHPAECYAPDFIAALEKAGEGRNTMTGLSSGLGTGLLIAGGFSWMFGYLGGMPQLVMRFMAISDDRQARRARNIGVLWTIFAYSGALLLGYIGLAIFGPGTLQDQEYVMPAVLLEVFPPVVAAILITGAIAAMISTADSLLVLSSTELSENIVKPGMKKLTPRKDLMMSRLLTLVIAVVALAVAWLSPQKLIFTIVSYVWGGIGGTFSVVILLTLFWKKYHGWAVLLSIFTGMTFTIVWISTGMEKEITSRIMTFVVTLLTAVLATYLIPSGKAKSH
jgi:sodium/proline symporter